MWQAGQACQGGNGGNTPECLLSECPLSQAGAFTPGIAAHYTLR